MTEKLDKFKGLKNIVVPVKQVPDTTQVKVDPENGTLIREGIPFIINPFDIHALEAALHLKDIFGSKVIAISMGPPNAEVTLRRCLALGTDEVILVSDRAFGGSDTLATSYVLAETIRKISCKFGPVDMVICGKQTIDGDTAQVGPGIAMRLGINQLTLVDQILEVDVEKQTITVSRKLDGWKEIVQAKLPVLLTVLREMNLPRYPLVNNRIASEQAEIPIWNNEILQLPPDQIGLKGSPTNVKKIFAPERKSGEILGDGVNDPKKSVEILIQKMMEKKIFTSTC